MQAYIKKILLDVKKNKLPVETALDQLKILPFEDIGFANIDHHRSLRKGFPEVIFCLGKTNKEVSLIAEKILEKGSSLLATRANESIYKSLKRKFKNVAYNKKSRTIYLRKDKKNRGKGEIVILSAGTSDISVAEEAAVTARVMGNNVTKLYDIGVAGIHRLFAHQHTIANASVIIVVAGMEGALSSVVGGITSKPVIAVPTSVGYGASFHGISALLGMLNSCAAGVTVVNIDNGFGAGYAASLINWKDNNK